MPLLIGAALALAVGLFATALGLDRDRAFYPVVTMVIGALYVLFAVMGGDPRALLPEALIGTFFIALGAAGFRWSLWIAVAALAAHGLFDLAHPHLITNPGVPAWWPEFCLAYDVVAALYLALALQRGWIRATA